MATEKLLLLGILLTLAVVGSASLIIGIRIMRGKIVIVEVMVLPEALCLLLITFLLLTSMIHEGFDFRRHWVMVGLILFFVWDVLTSKNPFGDLILFNAAKDVLYETMRGILRKRNITFEEREGQVILPSLKSEIRLSCSSVFKSALVRFVSKGELHEFDKNLPSDLIHDLKEKRATEYPAGSMFCIGLSAFALSMAVMLILRR